MITPFRKREHLAPELPALERSHGWRRRVGVLLTSDELILLQRFLAAKADDTLRRWTDEDLRVKAQRVYDVAYRYDPMAVQES